MIPIARGMPDEGAALTLAAIEASELQRVRAIIHQTGRDPTSDEIGSEYRVAGDLLHRRQKGKCAYCEGREVKRRNDVEHYRPKARANRKPGSAQTHGYWWLAWRWDNLLFACRNCNQIVDRDHGKQDHFPLRAGSVVLVAEQIPGHGSQREDTLLVDPASESGIDHIGFERVRVGSSFQWLPKPITDKGAETIRVCALARDGLLDEYAHHVEHVVQARVWLLEALGHPVADERWRSAWADLETWLYDRARPYVALSYYALKVLVPDDDLRERGAERRRPEACWA